MKITLSADATCGGVSIPKGEYWASFREGSSEVLLSGGGKDYKLPAKRRRATGRTKTTQVSFYSGGGKTWSLVISTPKHGEWVAMIEYGKDMDKKQP